MVMSDQLFMTVINTWEELFEGERVKLGGILKISLFHGRYSIEM